MIERNDISQARLVGKGQWYYDNLVLMPVQVFAINYDYGYEMDKADGRLEPGDEKYLNENGEQYVVIWGDKPYYSGSLQTREGGYLTYDEAVAKAESMVGQINWQDVL